MTQPERAVLQPESTDIETDSTFLDTVEFITGRDPNFGSFLLVVGMVTVVFIALFQFTLPRPISHVLTAGVIVVTVLSAIVGVLLDSLGYFDRGGPTTTETEDRRTAARPWVPAGGSSAPLPAAINFDAELRAWSNMFDGDLPEVFDPFIEDYVRLKTNTRNRTTIASDLRADLNPIGVLFEPDSEGDRIYEDVSQRLFRYINRRENQLAMDRVVFYDGNGTESAVAAIADEVGRVEVDVTNEGEAAPVEAVVTLYDADETPLSSHTYSAGVVSPGAVKAIEADIFIPAAADHASTAIRISDTR